MNSSSDEKLVKISYNSTKSIAILTLNRPKAYNALNRPLFEVLRNELTRLDKENGVKVIVLNGEGKAFCAGRDIKEMDKRLNEDVKGERDFYVCEWVEKFSMIQTPIIAAVNGLAFGGGFEIVMLCDLVYASSTAAFGLPEIKLGTIPGMGGTQRLAHRIGRTRAMEMILLGEPISAQEAKDLGLVNGVFEGEELMKKVVEKAELIAEKSGTICQMAKSAVKMAENGARLVEALDFERRIYYETFGTDAFREGRQAFLEKRKPHFKDEPPKPDGY